MTLASSLDLESLAKPILYPVRDQLQISNGVYTDWKRDQGIKTTDPFAVDPVLQRPLPLLVNPETLGTVPIFSDPTVILSARLPARQEAKNLDPSPAKGLWRAQDDPVSHDDTSPNSPFSPSRPSTASPSPHSSPNPQSSPTRSPSIGREDESAAPFGGSLPRFSHTPLIWDALQSRYSQDNKGEVKKKRSDALAFIKWKRNNPKARLTY